MLTNIGTASSLFFLQLLLQERGITDIEIGYLAILFSIFLVISNSISGKIADTVHRRKILLAGLFLSSISIILYIYPTTFTTFALIRIINGITLGLYPSSIFAIASYRKMPFGSLSAFGSFGWSIGVYAVGYIAELYRLELAFILGAIVMMISFLLAYLATTGCQELELNSNGNGEISYIEVIRRNWLIYLTALLRHGTAHAIWIFWPLFLKNDLNLSESQIGIVLAINPIIQAVMMKLVTDRGNPKIMYLVGIIVSALAFYTFTISSNFLEISLTQIILGISWAFFYVGAIRVLESENKSTNSVGRATGFFNSIMSMSSITGPIIAIVLFSFYQNYIAAMYLSIIVSLVASLMYFTKALKK
jgi:DHA1 family multidrug resistance protein-like MFS transporter